MSIYEYDEEKHMRQTREEGYEDGYEKGRESGYQDGLATGQKSGYQNGLVIGQENGIKALIQTCQDLSLSKQEVVKIIHERFDLSDQEIYELMQKYWN